MLRQQQSLKPQTTPLPRGESASGTRESEGSRSAKKLDELELRAVPELSAPRFSSLRRVFVGAADMETQKSSGLGSQRSGSRSSDEELRRRRRGSGLQREGG